METSQLICRANQLTGFYMMGTLVVKRLMTKSVNYFCKKPYIRAFLQGPQYASEMKPCYNVHLQKGHMGNTIRIIKLKI